MKFDMNFAYKVDIWSDKNFAKQNESPFRKNFVTLFQIPVNNMKPMHLSYVQLLLLVKLKP